MQPKFPSNDSENLFEDIGLITVCILNRPEIPQNGSAKIDKVSQFKDQARFIAYMFKALYS